MEKQNNETKQLTYDYHELDEYLSKMIEPDTLDQYFRGLHTAFTRVLQDFVCTGESNDLAFMPEESQVRLLDEFFQIIGRLNKKKGGEP